MTIEFYTYQTVTSNIEKLVNSVFTSPPSLQTRQNYFASLNHIQRHNFNYNQDQSIWYLDFCRSSEQSRKLLRHFMNLENDSLPDGYSFSHESEQNIRSQCAHAASFISKVWPHVFGVIEILVGCLIFGKLRDHGGASLADTLGVVWLNPQDKWTVNDYAEALIHESVHQARFLDEMISGNFSLTREEMSQEKYLVISSIRKVKRPYDLAFDSATVSVTLVEWYEAIGLKEKAQQYCKPTLSTLAELLDKSEALSARGREMLDDMVTALSQTESFSVFA
jgi:hypothetical protein